jgi:hypothetical protein
MFTRMFNSKGETRTAATTAEAPPKEGVTAKISRKLGLRGSEPEETPTPKAKPTREAANGAIRPADDGDVKTASTRPASGSLLNGAQPIVPTENFDSRWGAFR